MSAIPILPLTVKISPLILTKLGAYGTSDIHLPVIIFFLRQRTLSWQELSVSRLLQGRKLVFRLSDYFERPVVTEMADKVAGLLRRDQQCVYF